MSLFYSITAVLPLKTSRSTCLQVCQYGKQKKRSPSEFSTCPLALSLSFKFESFFSCASI